MKRDSTQLDSDQRAEEVDAKLRRRLELESAAEARVERARAAQKARDDKYARYLRDWRSANIHVATEFVLTEPEMNPIGANIL